MDQQVFAGLSMVVGEDLAEELPWELQDLGAQAVETRDGTTMSDAGGSGVLLIAGFEEASVRDHARAELERIYPEVEFSSADISDDGWSTGWRKFFKPVVLDTIQVITPWMDPPVPSLPTLVIDPGQAFGTGGHATTCLILQMLEARAKAGRIPQRVFDVGSGSGILSIAAVMMGAKSAEGIDIEEEAVAAVFENAERNGVKGQVSAILGSPDQVSGRWPLVLANIQLAVFQSHAAAIGDLVEKDGEILISGLLSDQVEACLELWPGFVDSEVRHMDGWAAIAIRPVEDAGG